MIKMVIKDVGSYLASLGDPDLIPTGLRTALVVGSLLFGINHGPALLRGEMTQERWISVLLSYIMPYLVSVYGQYSYRRKMSVKS
jgi:membrane protease YdiL (CAAX protease family)